MGQKDDWHNEGYATYWDQRAVHGNPTRMLHLNIIRQLIHNIAKQHTQHDPARVLELGSGSGLVSEYLLSGIENCLVEAVDYSEPMIQLAQRRLARFRGRFVQNRQDLASFSPDQLNSHTFHMVLAFQVIHELATEDKIRLLKRIGPLIHPEGVLIYGDRIAPNLALFWSAHEAVWEVICQMDTQNTHPSFHERIARTQGKFDYVATLGEDLSMLRAAGYSPEPLSILGERALIAARFQIDSSTEDRT